MIQLRYDPHMQIVKYVEPLYQSFCEGISRADFWALLGKLAVEIADSSPNKATLSVLQYKYGRKDQASCGTGSGRLPEAEFGGVSPLVSVFQNQYGTYVHTS